MKNNTNETILHVGAKSHFVYGRTNRKRTNKRKPHVYVLMYCNEIAKKKITIPPILSKLVLMIDSANRLKSNSYLLKELSKTFEISVSRIRHHFTEFIENDIMLRLSPSEYFVNPLFFTKSDNKSISNLREEYEGIKLEIVKMSGKRSKEKIKKLKEEIKTDKIGNKIIENVNNLINN